MKLVALACIAISLFCVIGCSGGNDADLSKQPDATMKSTPNGGTVTPPAAETPVQSGK